MGKQSFGTPLLMEETNNKSSNDKKKLIIFAWLLIALFTILGLVIYIGSEQRKQRGEVQINYKEERNHVVESEHGVVAADDRRCSEIGASVLRDGGHAVDATVATALCLGVVYPMSSGIGGGGFMIVRSSSSSPEAAQAFDLRETAPLAATQDMYAKDPKAKYSGGLSTGVPGEIAGLHEAWLKYGRIPWKTLFQPSIKLAKDGFVIAPYLANHIVSHADIIRADFGLSQVFAPKGKLLQTGDTCYNIELAHTLETIAEQGPQAFYNGTIAENFVKDVREAGGILTMEDMRNYKVEVTNVTVVDAMGYTILGMPPPSSGTLGLSLVLKILESYGTIDALKGYLGLHRLIEALKHMFAIRMNLGDPAFVNDTNYIHDMLSKSFAKELQRKIFDNTTFPPDYYMSRWSQLNDHGTTHFCVVDAERNAVSMTSTVNFVFGAGVLSASTGIVLNNEMDDFSIPTAETADKLPPAPANFIKPNKRPLSSMTPIIILKDNQLAGVIGGSGGMYIIPAVIQVFLNHFILGMEPSVAVRHPRIYHKLIPNEVLYENWTVIDGDHIELSLGNRLFLKERNHELRGPPGGAICQLIVQTLQTPDNIGRQNATEYGTNVFRGVLTGVSDPRKDGRPAAV